MRHFTIKISHTSEPNFIDIEAEWVRVGTKRLHFYNGPEEEERYVACFDLWEYFIEKKNPLPL